MGKTDEKGSSSSSRFQTEIERGKEEEEEKTEMETVRKTEKGRERFGRQKKGISSSSRS